MARSIDAPSLKCFRCGPQLNLLDFPGRGFGKHLKNHRFGPFKPGQVLTTMADDFICRCFGAGVQLNKSTRGFPPFIIGPRNNSYSGNRRMVVDHAFDLDRRNVLAP